MKIVNKSDKSVRADLLLASKYPEYSRAALAKLFDMQKIFKDNQPIRAGERIKVQEYIEADISPIKAKAPKIALPIIFEDENVVVIDKPTGIISHARGRYWDEASVASFIRDKVSGISGERAGIVHRLDRVTSGIMICAKNEDTLKYLQKQFNNRTVKKQYNAVIKGSLNTPAGIIDAPVARNPKVPSKFMVHKSGKQAQTEYKLLKEDNSYSLLNLHPLTGRTHQLRLHMLFIKHPIVGDELYGGEKAERLMLHATKLEITLPGGHRTKFESTLPAIFKEYIRG